jgi:nucleoside-diphosphate-sugar epimerase
VSGLPLRLGSLDTTRDFTFVADTAEGFLSVASSDACLGEVVNLGTGRNIAIRDVVRIVGETVGRELEVKVDQQRLRPQTSEVTRLLADASKAKRLAGWEAHVPIEEGLRRTVAWISEHIDLYQPEDYAV